MSREWLLNSFRNCYGISIRKRTIAQQYFFESLHFCPLPIAPNRNNTNLLKIYKMLIYCAPLFHSRFLLTFCAIFIRGCWFKRSTCSTACRRTDVWTTDRRQWLSYFDWTKHFHVSHLHWSSQDIFGWRTDWNVTTCFGDWQTSSWLDQTLPRVVSTVVVWRYLWLEDGLTRHYMFWGRTDFIFSWTKRFHVAYSQSSSKDMFGWRTDCHVITNQVYPVLLATHQGRACWPWFVSEFPLIGAPDLWRKPWCVPT